MKSGRPGQVPAGTLPGNRALLSGGRDSAGVFGGRMSEPKETKPKKIKPTPKRKPAKSPVNKALDGAPENKAL